MFARFAFRLSACALAVGSVRAAQAPLDPAHAAAAAFFGADKIYTFELTIAPEEFARMPPPAGRGGRGFGARGFGAAAADSGYPKVPAALRFEGRDFGRIGIRYKGNSSYRGAPGELKRSLKLEFDDAGGKRRFFGLAKLNLNNNAFDPSDMRETLAYDTFRRVGVPAPRTAYARVYITVAGQYDHAYAGVFTVVEQIDQTFFADRWGAKVGLLLKPEGLRGLPDFGTAWNRYEDRYGARGTTTPADAGRFMAFVHFVNEASDEEFAAGVAQYLDVDEFVRFLAGEVLIVNTDSPLAMNHNYWMTIDPRSGKVVWLPWDMNMAFGGFGGDGVDLSVFEPAARGNFPLADRILSVPRYHAQYAAVLRNMVGARGAGAELPGEFDHLASTIPQDAARDGFAFGPGRNGPPLRQFIAERLVSVGEQLDGKRAGTPARGRGFGPPGVRPF